MTFAAARLIDYARAGPSTLDVTMADRQRARPVSNGSRICVLLVVLLAGLYATDVAAVPLLRQPMPPATPLVLVDDEQTARPEAAGATAAGEESATVREFRDLIALGNLVDPDAALLTIE